jgi:hypothetical protein
LRTGPSKGKGATQQQLRETMTGACEVTTQILTRAHQIAQTLHHHARDRDPVQLFGDQQPTTAPRRSASRRSVFTRSVGPRGIDPGRTHRTIRLAASSFARQREPSVGGAEPASRRVAEAAFAWAASWAARAREASRR